MRRLAALDPVGLRRRGRHFIVASTGGGKSTLAEALLENYQARYPSDWLYIIDPKERFVPAAYGEDAPSTDLFPAGWREVRFSRRDGVPIQGRVIRHGQEPEYYPSEALLLQDEAAIWSTMDWLYSHSSVHTPALVYADESFDMVKGFRAHPSFRRQIQQGRELGTGMIIVNQRPRYIDSTFLSESEALYVGPLYHAGDRDTILEHVQGTPLKKYVEEPGLLGRHRWLYVDRQTWEKSTVFDLEIATAKERQAS